MNGRPSSLVGLKRACLVAVAVSLWAGDAHAFTAGEMLEKCEAAERMAAIDWDPLNAPPRDYDRGLTCLAYVMGAVQQLSFLRTMELIDCPTIPAEVTAMQSVRIYLKRLRDFPERHNRPAESELLLSMAGAFPCDLFPPAK